MFNLLINVFNKTETSEEQEKRKIILNVYDMLQPGFLTNFGYCLGIGIYHSGIEIGNHEYCFGGHDYEHVTGVFMVQPKIGPQGLLFKQSINMGYTNLSQSQVDKILQDMSKEYIGTSYNLLTRNCNHFSEDVVKRLTGKSAPGWINRAAKLGTMFPCVIPTEWVEPPDVNNDNNNNNNNNNNNSGGISSPTNSDDSNQDTTTPSSSSSYSSNTPLKKKHSHSTIAPLMISTTTTTTTTKKKKTKRYSSTPSSRRPSGSTDSIQIARTPIIQDDEINSSSPVKEPDVHRPDVMRSATQVSITAPVEL